MVCVGLPSAQMVFLPHEAQQLQKRSETEAEHDFWLHAMESEKVEGQMSASSL